MTAVVTQQNGAPGPSDTTTDGAVGVLSSGLLEAEIDALFDLADELDGMCHYAVHPPGKLFRPYLLLEACAAVGGDVRTAVPAALGAEYGHVASLVHDDIIDGDELRRGRASVPAEFGRDNAIVAGDALIFHLFLALARCADRGAPSERVVASLQAVARAGIDLCRGQIADGRLRNIPEMGLDDYIEAVRGKTGALFRGSCEVGALLGGGDEQQVTMLATYGEQLGVAFQMVDDLLAYRSTTGVAGKDVLSDLRNRQMTFPLIVARMLAPELTLEVLPVAFDRAADKSAGGGESGLRMVQDLLSAVSAMPEATKIVQQHAANALDALEALSPSRSRERLAAMITAAVERVA